MGYIQNESIFDNDPLNNAGLKSWQAYYTKTLISNNDNSGKA